MFDRALRLVMLDGLEQFEIALRTSLAYNAGMLDPFVHLRPDLLTEEFTTQPASTEPECLSSYDKWMPLAWLTATLALGQTPFADFLLSAALLASYFFAVRGLLRVSISRAESKLVANAISPQS